MEIGKKKRDFKIEILKLTQNTVEFLVTNTILSVANELRRAALTEVPTMAIDHVEITTNTSIAVDELITHRLENIPFYSKEASVMNSLTKCTCAGKKCAQCSVVYTIDITNSTPKSFLQVTTNHLTHVPFGGESTSVKPLVYPLPIVIVTLQHGESLKAQVVVAKGVGVYFPELFANPSDAGSTVGKWNFCTVSLREDPIVEIDTSCLDNKQLVTFNAHAKTFSQQCAMGVFEAKDRLEVANVRNCSECGRCKEILTELKLPKTVMKFNRYNDRWLLKLCTNGMLHAADALQQIVTLVKKKEEQLYEDAFPLRAMWKKLKTSQ